jgi:hypothetical protein
MGSVDAERVLDGRRLVVEVASVDEAWRAGVVQVLDGALLGEARPDGLGYWLGVEKQQSDEALYAV